MNRIWTKTTLRHDVTAGIVVFLVALPLCLGIAVASGMPPIAGIVAGAIGGIVAGAVSGSELSVSGPAAGLTLVVAGGIDSLGSIPQFGAAVLLAGLCQIFFGLGRLGFLSNFIPSAVIQGMLSYIGLVLIVRQMPLLFAGQTAPDLDTGVLFENPYVQLQSLWNAVDFNEGALIFACISGALLYLGSHMKRLRFFQWISPPLLVVVVGILTAHFIQAYVPHLLISSDFVQIPSLTLASWRDIVSLPDFSRLGEVSFWGVVMTIAAIASIETLLTVEATDQLDPAHRVAPQNRELVAQGMGNLLCGCLGGLPIAAVIVRSSANIAAGAKTKIATIVHGVLLVVLVIAIPSVLNRIPLACLAAILVMLGFKLLSPKVVLVHWRKGWLQFVPFVATFVASLAGDLIIGVAVGVLVALCGHAWLSSQGVVSLTEFNHTYLIRFNRDVNFLHKAAIRNYLSKIPDGVELLIDRAAAKHVDPDIEEVINIFTKTAPGRRIEVVIKQ